MLEGLAEGLAIEPAVMAQAYIEQVRNWRDHEPRADLIDRFGQANGAVLRLLSSTEFWGLVWDYWPGHQPHELMTEGGTKRLLMDVAHVYLRETRGGYRRPGFTDRVEDLRALIRIGHHPDPVFLLDAPRDVPPGGSFRIADGVGRMTALAAVALEKGFNPTPVAMIAET